MTNQQYLEHIETEYLARHTADYHVLDLVVGLGSVRMRLKTTVGEPAGQALYFSVASDLADLAVRSLTQQPVSIEQLSLTTEMNEVTGLLTARAKVETLRGDRMEAVVTLVDDDGHVVASAKALARQQSPDGEDDEPAPEQDLSIMPQLVWKTPFGLIFPN